MGDLKLVDYMRLTSKSVKDMATTLGRSRQNVEQWLAKDAYVVIGDGGRLTVMTMNVVHNPKEWS